MLFLQFKAKHSKLNCFLLTKFREMSGCWLPSLKIKKKAKEELFQELKLQISNLVVKCQTGPLQISPLRRSHAH